MFKKFANIPQITGPSRENFAAQLYAQNGFSIEGRNIRIGGIEVDIIASKHDHIHFVEVKARHSIEAAVGAIRVSQLRRIAEFASAYALQKCCRGFQIDAVCFDKHGQWQRFANIEVDISRLAG